MEAYQYKEDMKYVRPNNEREHQWMMYFEENEGGMDENKSLLHANRYNVYIIEKQ